MKSLILVFALTASPALAQTKPVDPALPPIVKLNVALEVLNGLTALVLGLPVQAYLLANQGAKPGVCEVMGGTFSPGAGDQCRDGLWLRLIPYVNESRTKS
jgi:hypothetical protein